MRRRTTTRCWAPPLPVPPMVAEEAWLLLLMLLRGTAAPSSRRRGWKGPSRWSSSSLSLESSSPLESSPSLLSRVRASSSLVVPAGAAAAPALRLVPMTQRPSRRPCGFTAACPPYDEPRQQQQQQQQQHRKGLDECRKGLDDATSAVTSSLWGRPSPASLRRAAPWPNPPPPPPSRLSAHNLHSRDGPRWGGGSWGGGGGGSGGGRTFFFLAASGSAAASTGSSTAASVGRRQRRRTASTAASAAAGEHDDPSLSVGRSDEARSSREGPRKAPEERVDLASIQSSTVLTGEDVENWIDRIEQCPDDGVVLLRSRDAVQGLVHLARAAMLLRGTKHRGGGGGHRQPSSPERSARLGERLLRACLSQRHVRADDDDDDHDDEAGHYPPVDVFNLVIMAWGNTKSEEGALRAEQIFELLLEQQCDDGTRGWTGGTSGSAADCKSDDDDDESPTTHCRRPPRPDRRTYKSLIRAWAVARCATGPGRAQHWLSIMEDRSGIRELLLRAEKEGVESNEDAAPAARPHSRRALQPPDRATYNVVLSGYARAPLSHANSNAHPTTPLQEMNRIVDRMDRLHDITASDEYRLDEYSYQALLMACSRQVRATRGRVDRTVVRDIEKWLTRMVRTLSSEVVQPLSDASFTPSPSRRHGADRTDTKDASKVVPWSWAVGVLVEALAKSKDQPRDARLAAAYLRVLAGRSAPRPGMVVGPPPRHEPRNPNYRSAPHLKVVEDYPSQECIWKVIQALERPDSESQSPTGADETSRDTIDELVRIAMEAPFPRIFFVNQAAEFWSQTGWRYAPDLVEQLMGSAWERSRRNRNASSLKPTGQTFAIAMRAWLRCEEDREEAPHGCELLLQQMLQLHQETSDRYYRPRDEHLRSVLTCWLKRCKDGKRYHGLAGHLYPAEHIEAHLQWHVKPRSSRATAGADDTTHDWVKNAAGHYSMAIRAWSQQVVDEKDIVDRVDRAVRLLDDLGHTVSSIPAFPCNWALEIFARPQTTLEMRKKAYDSAINTFRRGERNARTYVLMLKVLKTQVPTMDQNHLDVIEDLVKESCSSGMLTQDLIWRVVDLLNAESLQRLFGLTYQYATLVVQMRDKELHVNSERMDWSGAPPNSLLLRNLPPEWCCNIDRQRRISAVGHSYT